jgi:hypothetical protein
VLPAAAYAQASFSGLVKDTSGAVLPGVTVEASSPVLIEKSRSATTDGEGRYIIQDLRPGTYRVAFTLPGFKTVVRENVELLGTSVVTVNADMAVGTVEETNAGYYLLTYRSKQPRGASGFQKVTVSLKNPEFKVVSRSGYQLGS